VPGGAGRGAPGWAEPALRLAGPGLLLASGAIHLDLYVTGYKSIPTIGWLFLLQVIAAFALGLAALAVRSAVAALAAAGFSLATLGGYLLSVWIGLFGFKEVRTTAGIVAGVLEVAAFAALVALAAVRLRDSRPAALDSRIPGLTGLTGKAAGFATAGLTVVALVLLGVAVGGAGGGSQATPAGGLRTASIGGAQVLTNANGLTLYTFAPDTPGKSACYGSCAQYWPPLKGPVTATGIAGTFGTIKRTDGTLQATYNGRPLYTYIADSGRGQAHGNNLNLNGGLWLEATVRGTGG
jgi:predicted lipoprotein with Yx(FWY)xxD motif